MNEKILENFIDQRQQDKQKIKKLAQEIGIENSSLLIGFIHGMEIGIKDLKRIKSSINHL